MQKSRFWTCPPSSFICSLYLPFKTSSHNHKSLSTFCCVMIIVCQRSKISWNIIDSHCDARVQTYHTMPGQSWTSPAATSRNQGKASFARVKILRSFLSAVNSWVHSQSVVGPLKSYPTFLVFWQQKSHLFTDEDVGYEKIINGSVS